MKAVIQAGGMGTRLRPYTLVLPKPMMPLGNHPIIEVLLKWLRRWDVTEVYITTGYLGHLLNALCGDGSQWGLNIHYSSEQEPMGTIGPLVRLRKELDETFLVLNGDLITDLKLDEFTQYHHDNDAMVTVAVTEKPVKVDFGVIEDNGGRAVRFREKPATNFQVSMGVYCMEPSVFDLIPDGAPYGFDNLMHAMLKRELPVYVYKHKGLWIDIGQTEDFRVTQEVFLRDYKTLIMGA